MLGLSSASLLYAAGNGLEIITYVFPASFLLIATCANCLKQISMLTSSATRNAIYRSFAAEKNNIGEISAKGEAQIAVVDLLGMTFGICLSHAVGTSRLSIGITYGLALCLSCFAQPQLPRPNLHSPHHPLTTFSPPRAGLPQLPDGVRSYLVLSSVDIFAIYQEIRSVVFKSLNFERTGIVLRQYIASNGSVVVAPGEVGEAWPRAAQVRPRPLPRVARACFQVAKQERIFRSPKQLDSHCFRLLSEVLQLTQLSPEQLGEHLAVFEDKM